MISNPFPSKDNIKNPPPIPDAYVPERRSDQDGDADNQDAGPVEDPKQDTQSEKS